ncbi:YcaO-like family protein [Actinoplanes sp. NPDC026619]|uniref:YcaO-like family protein n=1 Tax=Actinoplanes sp. NPDC026619 TaxID=3155798 RepID=UPI0033E38D08
MPFRSMLPCRAVETAKAEVNRLGLTAAERTAGPSHAPVAQVTLTRDGVPVADGWGKGAGDQGVASAWFEALERYLMSAAENRRWEPAGPVLMSAREVASQPALGGDLVVQRWALEFPSAVAACATYDGPVFYPAFLTDPRYFRWPVTGDDVRPYRGLLRYSSSLGTAAGRTVAEAAYHGLCELIEHDGFSHALLRWYVAGDPAADEVPATALPDRQALRYAAAERATRATVHLLDVTTDLGVPAYVAISRGPRSTLIGAGASVWASDAAERALDELIQSCGQPAAREEAAAAKLAAWPALQRCVRLPLAELRMRPVPLRPDAGDDSAEGGLATAERALGARGLAHHTADIAPAGSLIAVTTTVAPGLERFSLVRHGDPVLPTGRGWHRWPSPTTAAAPSFRREERHATFRDRRPTA